MNVNKKNGMPIHLTYKIFQSGLRLWTDRALDISILAASPGNKWKLKKASEWRHKEQKWQKRRTQWSSRGRGDQSAPPSSSAILRAALFEFSSHMFTHQSYNAHQITGWIMKAISRKLERIPLGSNHHEYLDSQGYGGEVMDGENKRRTDEKFMNPEARADTKESSWPEGRAVVGDLLHRRPCNHFAHVWKRGLDNEEIKLPVARHVTDVLYTSLCKKKTFCADSPWSIISTDYLCQTMSSVCNAVKVNVLHLKK